MKAGIIVVPMTEVGSSYVEFSKINKSFTTVDICIYLQRQSINL